MGQRRSTDSHGGIEGNEREQSERRKRVPRRWIGGIGMTQARRRNVSEVGQPASQPAS
jgi:hypothetical protein